MSKSKDSQALKAVIDYLVKQNRPYSAIDVHNNLHKEYSKPVVVKVCESLAEAGKVKEKIYGKQKVYVADQSQFPAVDEAEIKEMDIKIAHLTQQVQGTQEDVRKLDSELKGLNSCISTEEAQQQLDQLTKECAACQAKLVKLKEGGVIISPQEKEKVYNARQKFVKEWRKRKRISNEIFNAILEGYPKTKKQLLEDIGVETDEDYNVSPPNI